jgi:hypothetical protein
MNWGKSIVLAFVIFTVFIATLVTVCVRQDISLVTKDYYQEELAYQGQIDRMAHTAMLSEKPDIKIQHGNLLIVSYEDFARVQSGSLQLFRPSDPAMDRQFKFRKTAETSLYFSTDGMKKGMYRARLKWTMDGNDFYLEKVVNL